MNHASVFSKRMSNQGVIFFLCRSVPKISNNTPKICEVFGTIRKNESLSTFYYQLFRDDSFTIFQYIFYLSIFFWDVIYYIIYIVSDNIVHTSTKTLSIFVLKLL